MVIMINVNSYFPRRVLRGYVCRTYENIGLKKDFFNFHHPNSSLLSLSRNFIPFLREDLTRIVIPPEFLLAFCAFSLRCLES